MKKKVIAIICILCLSAQLSGCNNEAANTISSSTEEIPDIKYSSDFTDENVTSITFHDINLEIPNNWNEDNSTDDMLYFYPDNGMLAVGFKQNGGNLSIEKNQDNFISSYLDPLKESKLLNQSNVTIGMMDKDALSFDFECINNGSQYSGQCIVFNVNNDIYCFSMFTLQSSEISYANDYQKIITSILTPLNINTIDDSSDSTDDQPVNYDALQNIFLNLTTSSTISDIETLIKEKALPYTIKEYNTSPDEEIVYVIAYTTESAQQAYADPGDRIKASFSKHDDGILFVEYTQASNSRSALLYNYGTWNSFRTDSPSEYTGYYLIDPLADEPGITIKYANGNETTTKYFLCDSAKDSLTKMNK